MGPIDAQMTEKLPDAFVDGQCGLFGHILCSGQKGRGSQKPVCGPTGASVLNRKFAA
jgi:hypothetical protein